MTTVVDAGKMTNEDEEWKRILFIHTLLSKLLARNMRGLRAIRAVRGALLAISSRIINSPI